MGSPGYEASADWLMAKYAEWGIESERQDYGTWRGWERGVSHIDRSDDISNICSLTTRKMDVNVFLFQLIDKIIGRGYNSSVVWSIIHTPLGIWNMLFKVLIY